MQIKQHIHSPNSSQFDELIIMCCCNSRRYKMLMSSFLHLKPCAIILWCCNWLVSLEEPSTCVQRPHKCSNSIYKWMKFNFFTRLRSELKTSSIFLSDSFRIEHTDLCTDPPVRQGIWNIRQARSKCRTNTLCM